MRKRGRKEQMLYNITQLPKNLNIGYIGETQFRTFAFDLNPWLEIIPDGVGSIVHIRPGETKDDAYICATTWQDGILSWTVNAGDLGATEGYGLLQIWLVGSGPERRGKSAILQTIIQDSVNSASSDVPSAQQAWMEQMTSLKTETVTAAGTASAAKTDAETARDAAQESATEASGSEASARSSATAAASSAAHFPRIRNGNWEVWDGATETWVDTGIAATGATPDLEIGSVTTLNPDQQAYVQITGTDENPVLNFGIPRGQTGSVDEVYGTTIPVSESDSTTVKQALDRKLETVPNMTGATAQTAGTAGLAPAPAAGDATRYLRSDGTWAVPPDTHVTVDSALNNASTNPVQNAVLTNEINGIKTNAAKLIPVISGSLNNSGYNIAVDEYFEADGSIYKATAAIPTGEPWSTSADLMSGTAVNDLQAKYASLNSKLTPTVVTVQPFGQWTEYTGGYYVIGNMVIVQVTAIAGNFGANDYFTMVGSLPAPAAATALSISTTSDNYKGAEAYVGGDGKLIVKSGANALTGQRVVVTGMYIKT